MSEQAVVTRRGFLDMQVCVPVDWNDKQVLGFASRENPCGTEYGWVIHKEGDKALAGTLERQPCNDHEGFVHIMLDA